MSLFDHLTVHVLQTIVKNLNDQRINCLKEGYQCTIFDQWINEVGESIDKRVPA